MLSPALLALTLIVQTPRDRVPPPTSQEVQATLMDLKAALKTRELSAIQTALERAGEVPHQDVVGLVAKAFRDDRKEVRHAAIATLRYMDHGEALIALHRLAKDKKWMCEKEYAPSILRAIGQHADPSSLKILSADPARTPFHEATRARILGLGNIRKGESIHALIKLMNVTGGNQRNLKQRYGAFNKDFRLSLIVLTGTDQGTNPELWERWWRKNKKTFAVSAKPIPLPKSLRYRWDSYWGRSRNYAREERREDRGT
jgi:hypothetical protein